MWKVLGPWYLTDYVTMIDLLMDGSKVFVMCLTLFQHFTIMRSCCVREFCLDIYSTSAIACASSAHGRSNRI